MTRTIKSALAAIALATGAGATTASAQSVNQMLYQLSAACMQGNYYACSQYDSVMMELQMQQMMMAQPAPTPGYDPNNVMGATHQQRMQNIQNWGAQNTANHNARMAASDARQKAFLETLNQ